MKIIDLISGARPNFIKIISIIRALEKSEFFNKKFKYRLIHTGQHFDKEMSKNFFNQLDIPTPDIQFNIGANTQSKQTADIMTKYEKLLNSKPSNLCLVVGDVTSTMACAIVAQKFCIQVAHVEAGIRSGDWTMPEEINRLVTDSITNHFFTTSIYANENLIKSGIRQNRIHFVGNTMIDTLISNKKNFKKPMFWEKYGLKKFNYFILTLHRPSNVDNLNKFYKILKTIAKYTKNFPIVFCVHPRNKENIKNLPSIPKSILFVEAQPYLEFNYLVSFSKGVITDSGGITEETTVLGIPCITLRDTTERPETIKIGTNVLIGNNIENIKAELNKIFSNKWKKGSIPKYWDGKTGSRIVKILENVI